MTNFPEPKLLLHPNIPKPLHGLNPRTIMGQAWWDEQRQRAYATHKYRCWACGVHKMNAEIKPQLEAHENYEIDYAKGRMKIIEIVALCPMCHAFIHNGRVQALTLNGEMEYVNAWRILHHGFNVLKKAGLPPNPFALRVAATLTKNDPDAPIWAKPIILAPLIIDNPMPEGGEDIEWGDWRLVFGGKEYKPLFPTVEDWMAKYNPGFLDEYDRRINAREPGDPM